jgi:hypothetical protein
MFSPRVRPKAIMNVLAALLLFATVVSAQIPGLCNTGETTKTALGCTGVLVTPNPSGGGPNRDGNWVLAYPYPTPFSGVPNPCSLKTFESAWVDTLGEPLPNSTVSEWISPYDGESNLPAGWYIYATSFHVPSVLPNGTVPTGVTINGQFASDNTTFLIYLKSPADSAQCSLVSGQSFPVNPEEGAGQTDQNQWWPLSFKNRLDITAGADALLYFVVRNTTANPTPTGLIVEFFPTSTFN